MGCCTRIRQRFGKKSFDVPKRGILTNSDYKKTANLGGKANFGKNGEFKGLAKYR